MPASANHSWGGYHWARTANPVTVQLGDNVDGIWDPYLVTAQASDTLERPSAPIDSVTLLQLAQRGPAVE